MILVSVNDYVRAEAKVMRELYQDVDRCALMFPETIKSARIITRDATTRTGPPISASLGGHVTS